MYLPDHFRMGDAAALEMAASAGVGHLVSQGADGHLESSFVPFLVAPDSDAEGVALRAHLSRANAHHRSLDGTEALVIVTGPDAYVSPSGYPSKAEHGKVVPTWNYAVVHLRGTVTVVDDAPWLRNLVTALTDRHEAGRPEPWQVSDAPEDYVEAALRGIVGVELRVTSVEGKAKLSQNRSDVDRAGATAMLAAGSAEEQAVARLMG